MTRRLADLLLDLAARLAPARRRPWIEALRAEAATMDPGPAHLRWASGGFLIAFGWWARREAIFLVTLLVALYAQIWITGYGMEFAQALGANFFDAANGAQNLTAFLLAAAFAAWRPRRAVLVFLLTPWIHWSFMLEAFFNRAGRLPVPWTSFVGWAVDFGWAAAIGAVVGALLGRRRATA